jgi:hypothetical protein
LIIRDGRVFVKYNLRFALALHSQRLNVVLRSGTFPSLLYFVFSLSERKNEIQMKEL